MPRNVFSALLLTITLSFTVIAQGYDPAQARTVFDAKKDTVVTIEVVVKTQMSMPGMGSREDESKSELTGTVIAPDGLALVCLSEIDPTSMMTQMMGGMMKDDLGAMKFDSRITSMKFIGPSGSEVEAEEVLRDQDLNIAVVRPKAKPEEAMRFIDINENATPEIFDTIISINRLGKAARRVHAASFHPIEGIVDSPRLFYILGNNSTSTAFGTPGFALDGRFVGFFTLRTMKGGGEGLHSYMPGAGPGMLPVLIPTQDLQEVIAQVPER